MNSALLVSCNREEEAIILSILDKFNLSELVKVNSCVVAEKKIDENEFDLCIINTPLQDKFGGDLARHISKKGKCQVILIADANVFDIASKKNECCGIFTIEKPINVSVLLNTIRMSAAAYNKIADMKKENDRLKHTLEDIKIINRAKCMIIEYLNLTEQQAHRYIERQAMDMRMTKRMVAESILKTYEN